MEKSIKVTLVREKATKNTYRYSEVDKGQPMIIGTLYIQKWVDPPETIEVTINAK